MIELVVVMATISLLATLAIPGFKRIRDQAESVAMARDMRTMISALDVMGTDLTGFPEWMTNSDMEDKVAAYIPPAWKDGSYLWAFQSVPRYTYLYVYNLSFTGEQNARIDAIIDDGGIGTGDLWVYTDGLLYFFENNMEFVGGGG